LIFRNTNQIVATICKDLRLKCSTINVGCGPAPLLTQTYRGPTSKGRERMQTKGRRRERKKREE